MISKNTKVLVADIGGTTTRVAIADITFYDNQKPTIILNDLLIVPTNSYNCPEDVFSDYIAQHSHYHLSYAVIAAAAPVVENTIKLNQFPWSFSGASIQKALNINHIEVINDFAAIACSIPHLKSDQIFKIGGGTKCEAEPIVVLGPGTGLGMAALAPLGSKWKIFSSEGGNISFAPTTRLEFEIMQFIQNDHSRVSVERLISGQGLLSLYQALCHIEGVDCQNYKPAELSDLALARKDKICIKALELFCQILGRFSSDMALTFNAQGGVYLAGGIIEKIKPFFLKSDFREQFENKGRLEYVKSIPTYHITEPQPALIGVAAWATSKSLYHDTI